ncbi:hypothetical protein FQR65_LT15513 [Abscondita terminalis]|nr:hypothetical protein FQR65_LT15513 [Abscondita terminalis]
MDYMIGGLAAVGAGFFTNPLEVVKIRMQLQGELAAKGQYTVHYRNIFSASYMIVKHDGILALQAGLVPALWFQLVLNGTRLGTYQILTDQGYTTDLHGNHVFYKSVIAGGLCGVLGGCTGSPLYLVKTHLQAQAAKEISFGHQHNHDGTWKAFKNIYNSQGIKGLFRGSTSAIPRAFVGSTAQLTSFDYCKTWFLKYPLFKESPLLTTFSASMVGGITISLCMTPFDLVSTRLYNQGIDIHGRGLLYSSYLDCVIKIWKSEGFLGFYKGIGPSYFRINMDFVIGGFAAVGSGFFTNPLELVKTRMQVQGELAAKGQYSVQYKNFLNAGLVIAKHDGILALQAGLVPAQGFQFILNGIRLGLFQTLTDLGFTKNKSDKVILHKTIILGGVCGVLGAVVGSPLYLIKTHLQTQAAQEISFGHQHNHDGTVDAFRKIYAQQGVKGLFRGTCSAIPRNFVGSTSQLTSFDYCKRWLNQHRLYINSPLLTTFTASFIGGFIATVFITPFDLISTRLYNQGVDRNGRGILYKNYADCVLKVCQSEGIFGLYKGFWAGYLRLGPHTVLSLVFWDQLKNIHKEYKFRAYPKTHYSFT